MPLLKEPRLSSFHPLPSGAGWVFSIETMLPLTINRSKTGKKWLKLLYIERIGLGTPKIPQKPPKTQVPQKSPNPTPRSKNPNPWLKNPNPAQKFQPHLKNLNHTSKSQKVVPKIQKLQPKIQKPNPRFKKYPLPSKKWSQDPRFQKTAQKPQNSRNPKNDQK